MSLSNRPLGGATPGIALQEIGGGHNVGSDSRDDEEVVEPEFIGTFADARDHVPISDNGTITPHIERGAPMTPPKETAATAKHPP